MMRSTNRPFHILMSDSAYYQGFYATTALGYAGAFYSGYRQPLLKHKRDLGEKLRDGIGYSIVLGTAVGLPVAMVWPAAVPMLTFHAVWSNL